MPVAERLYYDDSFLRTFTARVADIREYARTDGQSQWQIALDRTAFYPTSGGQPFDRGTLTATARSGAALVAEIDAVVEDDAGEVWHSTRKPLLAGTAVTGKIDWARRLDHMQQHTGQHLLSAVFARELGARTVSFHLGEQSSSINLSLDQQDEVSALVAALPQIEEQVNLHIGDDLPVSMRTVSGEEAQALLAAGTLRKLPTRKGPMRLIEIAGVDLNACGGTHVRALGQIGGLLLRGTERMKKDLRVEFVCGLRAVSAARKDFLDLGAAAASLSVGRAAVPAAVERLLGEAKAAANSQKKLREELAQQHAVQLAAEEHAQQGVRLVVRNFADRDAEYVKLLASRVVDIAPSLVVFTSTLDDPALFVLACSRGVGAGCGEVLRNALATMGLRGGGSPEMAQSLLPRADAAALAQQVRDQVESRLPFAMKAGS